jgi:hypothetical protein
MPGCTFPSCAKWLPDLIARERAASRAAALEEAAWCVDLSPDICLVMSRDDEAGRWACEGIKALRAAIRAMK